jgi:hypothetical protein
MISNEFPARRTVLNARLVTTECSSLEECAHFYRRPADSDLRTPEPRVTNAVRSQTHAVRARILRKLERVQTPCTLRTKWS